MKTEQLMRTLDTQDARHGRWLFTTDLLERLYPEESRDTLKASLKRHTRTGLLLPVTQGLFANTRARCMPTNKLAALVPYLRPGKLNYISQESRLSDLGVISQIPLDYLSMMTTGRSWMFNTSYGTVQFTHTQQAPKTILAHTLPDKKTGLLVADAWLARRDLMRSGRNTGMIDPGMMEMSNA